jgi:hypothetical protein
VRLAFWLYVASAVLSAASSVASIAGTAASRDDIVHHLAAAGQSTSTKSVSVVIGVAVALSLMSALMWLLLFLVLAPIMRSGASWTRIVLTVITALSFVNVASGYGLGALQVVASTVATVLLWLPPSNGFFAARKTRTRTPD